MPQTRYASATIVGQVEFRILGSLEVLVSGTPVALGGGKARALLAYLVLHRGSDAVSRDQLIDDLWGERPPKSVGAELRVYVAKIRKQLPDDVLVTRPDGYALRIGGEQVDAERFEVGARNGSALLAAGDSRSAVRTLADALALWRGPFLADLAYESWVHSEARRLDEVRLTAVEERVEADLAIGRHAELVSELAQLVREHPFRERLHGQLMVALYRSGRQAEALSAYRALRRVLRDELGLDPSPPLQRLEHGMLNHDPALEHGTRGLAPPARTWVPAFDEAGKLSFPREQSPFVGREAALELVLAKLDHALDGRTQVVFVKGEAGSGKTAILTELAHRAERADPRLVVVAGQCRPATGAVDLYAPFRQVLGVLVGDLHEALARGLHAPDQARRLWAASAVALTSVMEHGPDLLDALVPARDVAARVRAAAPELAVRLDELLSTRPQDKSAPQLPPGRIRDECVLVLDRIATHRPVVLLLDDVQWADPSTLDVLARLADERNGTQLAVIAAYRPEDETPSYGAGYDGWQKLQHDVKRRRGDVVLDLDEAAAAEARAFVNALLDREPNTIGARLRVELTDRSEGHALFAVELIRELKENGSLRRDSTGRWTESPHVDWDRWPARIEGLLADKFARLDQETRQALEVASVEGEEFTADIVAAVQDVNVDAVVRRLSGEATERHHIVRAIGAQRLAGGRVFRYRFTHNLFQRYLSDRLDDVRRPYLHERLASALEALGADAYEDGALALAHHLERAGIPERAVPYLHQAGLRAIRLSANEQAASHFSRAVTLVARLPEGAERRASEAELQLQLAIALSALRGFSAPEVERAYARATDLTLASAPSRDHFPIHFGLWVFYATRGDFDRSSQIVERMMGVAAEDADESLRLQALHARWPDSMLRGSVDDAIQSATEGITIYRPEAHHELTFRYGNHDPGVCALAALGLAHAASGDSETAFRNAKEGIDLSDSLGHSVSRAHARALAAWASQIIGDPESAIVEAEHALALQPEVDAPHFFALARGVRGWALAASGRHAKGAADLEIALREQLAVDARPYAALTAALLAETYLDRDRLSIPRAAIARLLSVPRPKGVYLGTPEILRVEARSLLGEGRNGEARRLLTDAIRIAREQGSWMPALRAALALVRMSSRSSDLRLLADVCARLPDDNRSPDVREARSLLGQAGTTRGIESRSS